MARRRLSRTLGPWPAAGRTGAVGSLQYPLRLRHAIALRVIDAQALQHVDDFLVFCELGDGLLAGQVADLIDRTHHLAVDGIMQYLFDEAAVDLQVVDREVLQITER